MSDTPRSDKVNREWPRESFGAMAELARQLERENADLREQLAERDAELAKLARTVGLLGVERSERDAAKNEAEQIIEKQEAEIAALKGRIKQIEREHKDAMRDVAAEASRAARFPDEPYGTY